MNCPDKVVILSGQFALYIGGRISCHTTLGGDCAIHQELLATKNRRRFRRCAYRADGDLAITLAAGEGFGNVAYILAALLLGFVAYGLSIYFYVYAQREIGAAKTSAYYAVAPFIEVVLPFIVLGERPNLMFFIALVIMIVGAWLAGKPEKSKIIEI